MRASRITAWVFAALAPAGMAIGQERAVDVSPEEGATEACDDHPPTALSLTKPIYPKDAYDKGIEGTVEIEFLIDTTGRVEYARILHSVPGLDAAAVECVKAWRFEPGPQGRSAGPHGRSCARDIPKLGEGPSQRTQEVK